MKIQFNTEKNLDGNERNEHYFTTEIAEGLKRFQSHITTIEVHLSDENGKKEGTKDKQCLLEVRLEGKQPIAVSCKEDTINQSVKGAIEKMKAALETIIGKMQNH